MKVDFPDPPVNVGLTEDGVMMYAVSIDTSFDQGYWLTQEQLKMKEYDFPERTVFIQIRRPL